MHDESEGFTDTWGYYFGQFVGRTITIALEGRAGLELIASYFFNEEKDYILKKGLHSIVY